MINMETATVARIFVNEFVVLWSAQVPTHGPRKELQV